MNAPNRFDVVAAAVEPFKPFPQGEPNDEYRLTLLLTIILPALNRVDPGKWGSLTKTDQANFVPCDIVVWKDTNEHVDALTGQGASWDNHGPLTNPAWVFTPLSDAPVPVPDPVPTPTPTTDPALEAIGRALAALDQRVAALDAKSDANTEKIQTQIDQVVKNGERSFAPLALELGAIAAKVATL